MRRPHSTTAALVVTVLAACASDVPSPSPTAAEPTAVPTATPEPTTTASPTPTATPDAATPDAATPAGWRRIAVTERGFSVAAPEGWEEISPDVLTGSGTMERMLEANPEAEGAVEQAITLIERGEIALFLFDAGETWGSTGFATNVNVVNIGPIAGTAEEVAEEIAGAITAGLPVIGEVATETVTLPAGEAARIAYAWEVADAAADGIQVDVVQYAILGRSGAGFIVSMSAAAPVADRYDDTFRQMAESFREDPEP